MPVHTHRQGLISVARRPQGLAMAADLLGNGADGGPLRLMRSLLFLHQPHGNLAEFEIERHVRDMLGTVIYGGTSDIQRNSIAGQIGV